MFAAEVNPGALAAIAEEHHRDGWPLPESKYGGLFKVN
jgi:hypothetical protein